MVLSNVRQRRAASELPCLPAEQDHHGDPVETDLHGVGHGTQPVYILKGIALLDGQPFRGLHAGQAGSFFEGKAGTLAGLANGTAEKAAPDRVALLGWIGRRKGFEHLTCVLIYTLLLKSRHVKLAFRLHDEYVITVVQNQRLKTTSPVVITNGN